MTVQPEIPFVIHEHENNHESRKHKEENRTKFSMECEKVYRILQTGVRLTVYDALVKYNISSLPRRCLDLKQQGVNIQSEWVTKEGKRKYKEYYLVIA
jgi:hypothetical protein